MADKIRDKINLLKSFIFGVLTITPGTAASGKTPAADNKEALISALMFYEGCTTTAYKCAAGVCTVGIGNTKFPDGTPVAFGYEIKDKGELEKLVTAHVEKEIEPVMNTGIKRRLASREKNSLISLCYNCGAKVLENNNKRTRLAAAVETNNKNVIVQEFLKYVYITRKNKKTGKKQKVYSEGLAVRRCLELFVYFGYISESNIKDFYIGGYRGLKLSDFAKKTGSGYILKTDLATIKKIKQHCSKTPLPEEAAETAWFGGDKTVREYLNSLSFYQYDKTKSLAMNNKRNSRAM